MNGPLRSKQGCWTCRLRKKKCDEGRPHCSTCESLVITCYGFGPKPDWMDNGERERAVAKSLKDIVKHTSRRRATAHSSKQTDSIIKIAPKSSSQFEDHSSSGTELSRQHGISSPSGPGSSQEDTVNTQDDESTDLTSPESDLSVAGSFFMSADDYVLLMYFLDTVFPLQYPMYKPGILEGGRGWLLSLLLRTKPLYHAALAFGAYHRRTTVLAHMISHPCQAAALIQQEKHLEICLSSFNQSIQNSCPGHSVGVLASITQLLFFELFTGNGNAWQTHLRAATSMYDRSFIQNTVHSDLIEKSQAMLDHDFPISQQKNEILQNVAIVRFLGGTIIWLDILSSVTAGLAPRLQPYHSRVIAPNSSTKLEDIIGCRNWVALQIGRIAALYAHKNQSLRHGHFKCTEFQQNVADINRDILAGMAQDALEGFNIAESNSTSTLSKVSNPHTIVTHMFAYMASVYLHLIIHGFQKLELLDTTIASAIQQLKSSNSISLLPALVAPLYFIGSVAQHRDEDFFRTLFSSPPLRDPTLQHRGKILPVLEEVWRRRQVTYEFAWKDCLEITQDILLV